MDWYYVKNERQEGPIDDRQLQDLAGKGWLEPGDLVWNETMGEQWQEARTIPGLFPEDAPPPLPEAGAPGDGGVTFFGPVGPAWRAMVRMLFKPFVTGKWFVLGFTAWLATLGQGGGGGGIANFRSSGYGGEDKPFRIGEVDWQQMMAVVRGFLAEWGSTIAWITAVVVAVSIVFGLAIMWFRSRGKFMFLDNVVNDRAEISGPWHTFSQHGKSLFLWCFLYGLIAFAVSLLVAVLAVYTVVIPCARAGTFDPAVIPGIVLTGSIALVFGLAAWYIGRFLEDFVIPIMYIRDLTATEAWGVFLGLMKGRFWRFIGYGIVYWFLGVVAATAVVIVVLITCCVTIGCLIAIPYIGAVVLLPVSVFFRLYSLGFLAQFGPEYRVGAGVA